ncbi:hypothetical protein XENTR_v10003156 [Xenopus tropicalis]|nr:hypothetical protein XENTR_v10003156 [Xenopus tropicalis]
MHGEPGGCRLDSSLTICKCLSIAYICCLLALCWVSFRCHHGEQNPQLRRLHEPRGDGPPQSTGWGKPLKDG